MAQPERRISQPLERRVSQEGRRARLLRERMFSQGNEKCLFKGNGKATLTIFGYESWKHFLTCDGRELTPEEIVDVQYAADYQNYSVDGVIRVEWPDVTVEFNTDRFLGGGQKGKKPIVLSATQNFTTIMHPFTVRKEWFKGLDSKDTKRLEGFEWVFEQDVYYNYKGHIRKGREIFVTFEFQPDYDYHRLEI